MDNELFNLFIKAFNLMLDKVYDNEIRILELEQYTESLERQIKKLNEKRNLM